VSWKPQKWDEEIGTHKGAMMLLAFMLVILAFIAGRNSNPSITGAVTVKSEAGAFILVAAVLFILGMRFEKYLNKRSM
jgi:hypothetical protein